jgi:DHA1 family bicyclomycin/chloramphenicol resistance-like MFS transporter
MPLLALVLEQITIRIVASIVRDRFAGREMARVMSFVMMIFITVPIFAPGIGSLFLVIGGWRLIFATMLLLSVAVSLRRIPRKIPECS